MQTNLATMQNKVERLARLTALRSKMQTCMTPALNNLDKRLEKYLNFDNGIFIEAGANDGYTQSNSYYYETCRGWSGVLVEAIPALAEICQLTRPDAYVVNCALVADTYSQQTVTMKYANLTSIVDGVCGDPEREQRHVQLAINRGYITSTYDIEVPARTLTSILEEAEITSVDFFSLDVEHYELSVLQGLDFSRFAPRYLLVETRQPDNVKALLPDTYRLVEHMTEMDFLFKRVR